MVAQVIDYTDDGYVFGDAEKQRNFIKEPKLSTSRSWSYLFEDEHAEPLSLADCGEQ